MSTTYYATTLSWLHFREGTYNCKSYAALKTQLPVTHSSLIFCAEILKLNFVES